MVNSQYVSKNWKYLSLGLMAVVALGFSFPQAFATPTDTVLSLIQQMDQKIDRLQSGVDALTTADSYIPPTCITLDVNRDGLIDKYEISPPPHTQVDYFNCDLSSTDLSGADLRDAHLVAAILHATDLSGANLAGADLSGAFLQDVNFDGADLTGADFTGCLGDPIGTPAAGTLPDCA